jgi:TolB-like protein/Tfp pilus assembly protein PilF
VQYEFGRFRLDSEGRLLFRDGERMLLAPKAVDVLLALLERRGAAVTRHDLLTRVWSDTAVEEGTLTAHVSLLRKTLGRQFIETIPKRGYRFVGDVEEVLRKQHDPERLLLAVLPFENLSGTRKYDSFSDGLTEEMITALGRLNPGRLGVIARTSSMTYKGTEKTIEQIGRQLAVSHVLEGSARRDGNRVRITAQLIQVSDQTHVWADTYEAELKDILALQSRVAHAVADQIQIKLQVREASRQLVPEAYEQYLLGRHLWNRRTDADLQLSIRCFQQAIDIDPAYAAAYAGMADCYLTLSDHSHMAVLEATGKARELLRKALQLDERLVEGHVSLAHAAFHEFDWETAEREFRRGIDLNPNEIIARHFHSNYLVAMGRTDEAIAEAEHATRLDPVSPAAQANLSSILWHARRFDRAIEHGRKVVEFYPQYSRAYEDLGRAYEQAGQLDLAIATFRRALEIEDSSGVRASLAFSSALAGKIDEVRRIAAGLKEMEKTTFVSSYSFALVALGLGDVDETFRRLNQAYDERSSSMPFLKTNPRFDSIRGDARFAELLERLRL